MVLTAHGRKTRVADLHDCISAGRDGVSAALLAKTAREHGLRTRCFSGEPEHFKFLPLPAIVHWNFKHFIVVERWSPKAIDIVDPAFGRRTLTPREFDEGFTGIILTFEPSIHFDRRAVRSVSPWRTYLRYVLGVSGIRSVLLQILAGSLLLQALGLVLPVATKIIVDQILPRSLDGLLAILGLGLGVVVVMQTVTIFLRHSFFIYLQARLDSQMMLGFFEHMLRLPLPFFQQRSSGDLIMRLNSNTIIREVLTNQTLAAILDGSLVLVYLAILLSQAPLFGMIVLVLGLVQISIPLGLARRVRRLLQESLQADGVSQGYLVEALSGITTLKATGSETQALDRWSNLFFERLNLNLRRNFLNAVIHTSSGAIGSLAPLALLFVGARLVLTGDMSLGTMLAFNALGVAILQPLGSLVGIIQQLQFGAAHFVRIFDVLETEPEPLRSDLPSFDLLGGVELREVSFRYTQQSPKVLDKVSLHIEPGEKIAIVGPTGSGKTTLGMLLLGLYSPSAGEILYDGVSADEIALNSLRQQFGVVLQDPALFSGSIRQNIELTRVGMPLEAIREAARRAAIHDEIDAMPMGYETIISERGGSLSGGQLQRIALARALLAEPRIILLDEATSHLDVLTEQRIDTTLKALRCTRIVVAHRLSTIRDADRILVLDAGQIRERGTHEELLHLDGHYARLIRQQLENDTVGVAGG
ncbi:MAG: peptidase domain-containing ABC transporter [Thermoanaerobaculia bacterium]|nr:peptidase domain-containing ABC transporter [Thermoanaerobaculia bacterium]